jgi:hypothetical protein
MKWVFVNHRNLVLQRIKSRFLSLASRSVLILDTNYLLLKKMSNAERRVQMVEVGYLIQIGLVSRSNSSFIAFLLQILRRSEAGDAFEGGIKIGAC